MRAIRAVYAISLLSFPILEARVPPQEALLTVVATAQGQTEITVSGRVTDEDGRPIVGARVQWGRSTARTDTNGNYSWRGTPTNSQWLILRVDHPEFPSIQSRIKLDTVTTLKQDFVLRTGGTVSGKVTTPDGPLLGVRILSRGSDLTRVWQSATTDPGGRYQIKLAEGNHTLVADHPDYAPASAPVSIEVGKTTVVDLVLTMGEEISGQVLNEAGNPVAGANVYVSSRGSWGSTNRQGRTNRAGRFEVWGLAEGDVVIFVRHRSYAPLQNVSATAGATDLKLVLKPAKFLSGRVVSAENGQPLLDFEVYTSAADRPTPYARRRIKRLPGGRFIDTGGSATPYTKLNVIVSAPGYAWLLMKAVDLDSISESGGIDVALSPGKTLKGRVVSHDMQPVVGAKVHEVTPGHRFMPSTREAYLKSGRSDESGSFVFEGISAEGTELLIMHPEFVDVKRTAVPRGTAEPIIFQLDRGLSIAGQVIRGGGPAEGLRVTAFLEKQTNPPLDTSASTTTDAEGRYRLDHLPPGQLIVSLIEGEGRKQILFRREKTELLDQNVTLDFKPLGTGRIHGHVVLDGKPVAGVHVHAAIGEDDPRERKHVGQTVTDSEGLYTLEELPAERIYLNATKTDLGQRRDRRIYATGEVNLHSAEEVEYGIDLKIWKVMSEGKRAPDFTSTRLDGSEIRLSDYRGKVVLLDFWATWCAPCIAEIPNVKAVYDKYHQLGLEILGISLDSDRHALENFVNKEGLKYPQVFDGKAWQSETAQNYGVWAIPATFLIDRNGIIRATRLWGRKLEQEVAKLIGYRSTMIPLSLTPSPAPRRNFFRPNRIELADGKGSIRVAGKDIAVALKTEGVDIVVLYVDRNGDGDPSNDPGLTARTSVRYIESSAQDRRWVGWRGVELGGEGLTYNLSCSWSVSVPLPDSVGIDAAFGWRAPLTLEGRELEVVIFDDELDGVPSPRDVWVVRQMDDERPVGSEEEERGIGAPWIETDRTLEVKIDPQGSPWAQLSTAPPGETVTAVSSTDENSVELPLSVVSGPHVSEVLFEVDAVPVASGRAKFRIAGEEFVLGISRDTTGAHRILQVDRSQDGDPFNDRKIHYHQSSIYKVQWTKVELGGEGRDYGIMATWPREEAAAWMRNRGSPPEPKTIQIRPEFFWRAQINLDGQELEILIVDGDVDGGLGSDDLWLVRRPIDRWKRINSGLRKLSQPYVVNGMRFGLEDVDDSSIRLRISQIQISQQNSIRIISISPDISRTLYIGDTVEIEVKVDYVLTDPAGVVGLVIQKMGSGGKPLVNEMEVVSKGKGTISLKQSIVIPETSGIRVFTPLFVQGILPTTTVDWRFYKVQKQKK